MHRSKRNSPRPLRRWLALAAALLLLVAAPPLAAQQQSGNLYGRVTDTSGAALPGATVTLTGVGATQVQQTDTEGDYRFLGLSPGQYRVEAALDGFFPVDSPEVTISVGRSTTASLRMSREIEGDVIQVTANPLIDAREISRSTTVTQVELEKIPSARDPWVILSQAPGVLTDRINVGGSESGQQSNFISPGTDDDNSVWSVDGVVITDMGATGSSATYYNFDSFEEMQVTTGGTDVSLATGGVTMNMVTKRGTNEWRFSGRYLLTDDAWQSSLDFDPSELPESQRQSLAAAGLDFSQGNRITDVLDYGLEGGGPIVRDKLWVWGSYGVQEIDLLTAETAESPNGVRDFTELESYAAKLNAQLGQSNSATVFYHFGDKVKIGRNAGPNRPAPTTWDQTGPTDIYKVEDTQIFSSAFYLTGMLSHVGGGFQFAPQGGGIGDPSFPNVTRTPELVWQNSFQLYRTDRPQDQVKADGNYFFNTGAASHELRFGVGYRDILVDSFSSWPGQQLVGLADLAAGEDVYVAWSATVRDVSNSAEYTSGYLQDTISIGNLTANVGLRYDLQEGRQEASSIPAAPVNQGILLGGEFAGADPGFDWETITPRLGLTYALGEKRDTLLRLSYSQFADQLSAGNVGWSNPTSYQYGYFYWYDRDQDLQLTADEVGDFFGYAGSVDPSQPGVLVTPFRIDPNLEAPITQELLAGVEHALKPDFVVGANVTWRNYSDILEGERLVCDGACEPGFVNSRPHRASDYELAVVHTGTLPDGTPYSAPQYTLVKDVVYSNGQLLTNSDKEQDYLGVSLTFNKRLANRWMMRGHVTWSDWEWNVPASEIEDPTRTLPGGNRDGDPVLQGSGTGSGAKGGVFINSRWSYDLSGLYQVAPDRPWGFNLAANVNGRQGYAIPYSHNAFIDDFGTRGVQAVENLDDYRHDDVMIVNARLEKELALRDWGLTLSLDAFNLFNESYVLQRQVNLASRSGDWVQELVSPRIFRIGARVNFR